MKIGTVPASLLKEHSVLTARFYLGVTKEDVARQEQLVERHAKVLVKAQRKLADMRQSLARGALPGVKPL